MIANGLVELGIKPGDHVAMSCPNLPYFPMAYYGILKVGAVAVTLNVLLKPREIAYHLQDSDAKALICYEGTAELPMRQMSKAGFDATPECHSLIVITANPAAPSPVEGAKTLGQLMHNQPEFFIDEEGAVQLPHLHKAENDELAWVALTESPRFR